MAADRNSVEPSVSARTERGRNAQDPGPLRSSSGMKTASTAKRISVASSTGCWLKRLTIFVWKGPISWIPPQGDSDEVLFGVDGGRLNGETVGCVVAVGHPHFDSGWELAAGAVYQREPDVFGYLGILRGGGPDQNVSYLHRSGVECTDALRTDHQGSPRLVRPQILDDARGDRDRVAVPGEGRGSDERNHLVPGVGDERPNDTNLSIQYHDVAKVHASESAVGSRIPSRDRRRRYRSSALGPARRRRRRGVGRTAIARRQDDIPVGGGGRGEEICAQATGHGQRYDAQQCHHRRNHQNQRSIQGKPPKMTLMADREARVPGIDRGSPDTLSSLSLPGRIPSGERAASRSGAHAAELLGRVVRIR